MGTAHDGKAFTKHNEYSVKHNTELDHSSLGLFYADINYFNGYVKKYIFKPY